VLKNQQVIGLPVAPISVCSFGGVEHQFSKN
jgi:hypothetical protein